MIITIIGSYQKSGPAEGAIRFENPASAVVLGDILRGYWFDACPVSYDDGRRLRIAVGRYMRSDLGHCADKGRTFFFGQRVEHQLHGCLFFCVQTGKRVFARGGQVQRNGASVAFGPFTGHEAPVDQAVNDAACRCWNNAKVMREITQLAGGMRRQEPQGLNVGRDKVELSMRDLQSLLGNLQGAHDYRDG